MKAHHVHCDANIGATFSATVYERKENITGSFYWTATETPATAFGHEIDAAPLVGIGKTKEIAKERLEQKKREFAEGLWA